MIEWCVLLGPGNERQTENGQTRWMELAARVMLEMKSTDGWVKNSPATAFCNPCAQLSYFHLLLLHTSWINGRPYLTHFARQFGIILLEFGRCFGEQDNHRIDATANDTHKDAGNDQTNEESEYKHIRLDVGVL